MVNALLPAHGCAARYLKKEFQKIPDTQAQAHPLPTHHSDSLFNQTPNQETTFQSVPCDSNECKSLPAVHAAPSLATAAACYSATRLQLLRRLHHPWEQEGGVRVLLPSTCPQLCGSAGLCVQSNRGHQYSKQMRPSKQSEHSKSWHK